MTLSNMCLGQGLRGLGFKLWGFRDLAIEGLGLTWAVGLSQQRKDGI